MQSIEVKEIKPSDIKTVEEHLGCLSSAIIATMVTLREIGMEHESYIGLHCDIESIRSNLLSAVSFAIVDAPQFNECVENAKKIFSKLIKYATDLQEASSKIKKETLQ